MLHLRWIIVQLCTVILIWASVATGDEQAVPEEIRTVTVADIIRIVEIDGSGSDVARFSPDGQRFVITVKKGNITSNTNDYSLLLFRSDRVFQSPVPLSLVSFSSSSNRPGIQEVRWLDNTTIAFLGENPSELQQLYIVDCETKRVRRLTHHSTSLTSYAMSASSKRFFFTAEQPVKQLLNAATSTTGLVVSNQALSDLISLQGKRESENHQALFVQQRATGRETLIQTRGITSLSAFYPSPELSPNGRYLIVKAMVTENPPQKWSEYQDRWLQMEIREHRFDRTLLSLYRFELIDAKSGESKVLLNAPTGFAHSEVAWSPDSRSVAISGTYLPLGSVTPPESEVRRSRRFVVDVTVPDGKVAKITDQDLYLVRWKSGGHTLLFKTTIDNGRGQLSTTITAYQYTGGRWKEVKVEDSDRFSESQLEVTVKDDINTRPKLIVRNVSTGQESLLLDPNPWAQRFTLGRVESITFRSSNGRIAAAALYLPVGYVANRKYPLVIQTHAARLDRFVLDGPYPTAFAAQPLAGKGFVVAQLKECFSRMETKGEVSDEASEYEGIIDYLDGRGLIDRTRVGIIAFSRTGLPVEYALTHSKYHFAAASLADISDAGYFRYIALLNHDIGFARDSEIIVGSPPFGKGLLSWLKNSPGFNLDKAVTPVRLEANDPMALLFVWEWFAGLRYLRKPVELVYLPDADHVLVKPRDRIVSQQGNVDWFCFWLKRERDSDPAKADQYRRWQELRKLQEASR